MHESVKMSKYFERSLSLLKKENIFCQSTFSICMWQMQKGFNHLPISLGPLRIKSKKSLIPTVNHGGGNVIV